MNRRSKYIKGKNVNFEEVLLDGTNLPDFDTDQMEGMIEQPISKKALAGVSIFFIITSVIFILRLGNLQIAQGSELYQRSEQNRQAIIPIFSERGIITDRNGNELAWNIASEEGDPFYYRKYTDLTGFSHILGYVGYPTKDNAGFWQKNHDRVSGRDGIEKLFDEELRGQSGQQLVERDAKQTVKNDNIIKPAKDGINITLTIDSGLQHKLHESMKAMADEFGYQGGAGVIIDVKTGELLALTNYPEYNSNILSDGENTELINEYFTSHKKPFLNRAATGLYTPGSTIKPLVALAALNEGVITEESTVLSTGEVAIKNPFNPKQVSIFKDWKDDGHGRTDVKKAIAESVNTFFYAISGGYKNQKGVGIDAITKYLEAFELATPSGITFAHEPKGTIPNPAWKKKTFNDNWRIGDTYITSIGQFGFQTTPLQLARSIAAIANGGHLITPHINTVNAKLPTRVPIQIDSKHFQTVRAGMRMTVTDGTAGSLNVSYVNAAAKTGTAQIGINNEFINSWAVGFFPYEKPRYAFALVMERGPNSEYTRGASWAIRDVFDWMSQNTPIYFEIDQTEQEPIQ